MTINSVLSMAQQAMQVNQYALNVVSNNISNMNTPGYSKLRVNLAEAPAYNKVPTLRGLVNVGTGVQIASITSYRDTYLDEYFHARNSDAQLYNTMGTYATYIESMFKEELDGKGLSGSLASFFDSIQKLTLNPTDVSLRANFVGQAQLVAQSFNSISQSLSTYRESIVGDVYVQGSVKNSLAARTVDSVNEKLDAIAKINMDIAKSNDSAVPPSALIDQRAVLLDELSDMIPITVTYNENGTASVSMNGNTLIQGAKQQATFGYTQGTADTPCIIQMLDMNGDVIQNKENINSQITSGTLGAYLNLGGSGDANVFSISNVLAKLDQMAAEFAKAVNDIQTYNDGTYAAMGISIDNVLQKISPDDVIFLDNTGGTTGITAANIRINTTVANDPRKVAVARVEVDSNGDALEPEAIGNALNMKELLALKENAITGLNGMTVSNYLISLVNDIGSQAQSLAANANTNDALATAINSQRESVMGVNLDEELMDLIKYQRAYESCARVFNTANDIYEVLVNLGR